MINGGKISLSMAWAYPELSVCTDQEWLSAWDWQNGADSHCHSSQRRKAVMVLKSCGTPLEEMAFKFILGKHLFFLMYCNTSLSHLKADEYSSDLGCLKIF